MRFVLIHGAYHGSWCWARLGRELESHGHEVFAADLPCEDGDAGGEAYVAAVLDSIPGPGDAHVVVGHSLGGLIVPLVAGRGPVPLMGYVCCGVRVVGGVVLR